MTDATETDTRGSSRWGPALYVAWAVIAIALSVASGGLSPENTTRLAVIAFLLAQIVARPLLVRAASVLSSPRARYVVTGTVLAAVVEGFHMISVPVFRSVRVLPTTSATDALKFYAIDLLFTVPAYLVVLNVMWWLINRMRFSVWQYVLLMGLAQTLGDGGIFFFAGAPALLAFLPYPMTNYHAMNVIPFLSVRDSLPEHRRGGARLALAIPAVIATYLVCGAAIKVVGKLVGFE